MVYIFYPALPHFIPLCFLHDSVSLYQSCIIATPSGRRETLDNPFWFLQLVALTSQCTLLIRQKLRITIKIHLWLYVHLLLHLAVIENSMVWVFFNISFRAFLFRVLLTVNIQVFNYTRFMDLSLCFAHPLSDDTKKQRSTLLLGGSSHLFSPQNSTSCQHEEERSPTHSWTLRQSSQNHRPANDVQWPTLNISRVLQT